MPKAQRRNTLNLRGAWHTMRMTDYWALAVLKTVLKAVQSTKTLTHQPSSSALLASKMCTILLRSQAWASSS